MFSGGIEKQHRAVMGQVKQPGPFCVTLFSSLKKKTRSLVVRDLRSETNSSRFESGCYLYAEVSSLQ